MVDKGVTGGAGTTEPDSGHPQWIGAYKLLDVLGEGGMGIVYLAEQTEPVRRRVALKIIKLGLDTRQVVARFESERQALAVMDHPNIAKVFDGGATESGRPYFVMELVRGTPITEYADTHTLTTDERLRLFMDVCAAVQHAHQKGVIHRDLKPSNVLVEVRESTPVVKVIDFGIAKAMGHELTDRTLVTRLGQLMGTPEYMSPEQAEMSGLDVDTRTDIYSLGVMLYELMVGTLPYDLGGAPDLAVQVSLREREVPKPSTRLTSLGQTQTRIAVLRQTTPEFLRRELKGDLDWIILMAMEKDRTRRYETANGLAMDIRRHLNDEPVIARPPSARYRLHKFVRRNRTGVLAAGIASVAIVAGAAAATVGMVNARTERARAEREAATALSVSDFLVGLFRVSDPGEAQGNTITAREILDRGADRIGRELAGQPLVQARLLRTVGDVYRELGLYADAEPLLTRAVTLAEQVPGGEAEMVEALHRLGVLQQRRGLFAAAESTLTRAILTHRALNGDVLEEASLVHSLASAHQRQGRYTVADSLLAQVLEIRERLLPPDDARLATTLSDIGLVHWQKRELASAEPYLERALAIRERVLGENHPDLAAGFLNLGALLYTQEKYAQARVAYERALRIYETSLDADHPRVAMALNNLAEVDWVQRDFANAERKYLRALAIKERTLAPGDPSLATTIKGLADVYRDDARYAEAEPLYRRARSILEGALGSANRNTIDLLEDYARMLRVAGRAEEAAALDDTIAALRAR